MADLRIQLKTTSITAHVWPGAEPAKKTIIALPGFIGNGNDFDILHQYYEDHPIIIAPDLPDYYQPHTSCDNEWDLTLNLLDELIDETARDTEVYLLGYSMGGRIALQYATHFKKKLAGLILIGATPGLTMKFDRELRQLTEQAHAKVLTEQGIETFLKEWFKLPLISTQLDSPEPYRSKRSAARANLIPETVAYYIKSLGTGAMPNVWDKLSTLDLRTFLLTGEDDPKYCACASKMSSLLPTSEHHIISNAGHAPHFESPSATAEAIKEWIENE